jgi:hypothetical protein
MIDTDLLKEWRVLIEREARAAAEAVVRERAGEVERALADANEALAKGRAAAARAETTSTLVESLSEILKRAPREVFLSDATLAILTSQHVSDSDNYDAARKGADGSRTLANFSWQSFASVLIQRHAAPLPAGRYAVVVSFHRIGGGAP